MIPAIVHTSTQEGTAATTTEGITISHVDGVSRDFVPGARTMDALEFTKSPGAASRDGAPPFP